MCMTEKRDRNRVRKVGGKRIGLGTFGYAKTHQTVVDPEGTVITGSEMVNALPV